MTKFQAGERVQLTKEYQDGLGGPSKFACSGGLVRAVKLRFPGTPLEKTYYNVRFDRGLFFQPFMEQVYELSLNAESLELINDQ